MTGTRAELSQDEDMPGPRASAARLAQELCSTEAWSHRGSILRLVTASLLHTSPMRLLMENVPQRGLLPSHGKTTGLQISKNLMWDILLLRTLSGLLLPTSMQNFSAALVLQEEQGL